VGFLIRERLVELGSIVRIVVTFTLCSSVPEAMLYCGVPEEGTAGGTGFPR
jgi:hypothetical protein